MKMIPINSSLPESSEAVFGTWALGGGYWGPQDHSDSVKAIHAALRGGINHFDTAPVYGKGRAETLLGQQIRKIRDRVIISDKCFFREPDGFDKSFRLSLRRLNTDYIDIFYIHWPAGGADMRPLMELMESYRSSGLIRAIGVSNFSRLQMEHVSEAGRIDIAQFGYNMLWRKEEEELIPYCRANGIKTAAYSVLAQGILTGKFREIPEGDDYNWRRKLLFFDSDVFPVVRKAVGDLAEAALKFKMSPAEAAIFWTKENELIDCSILGCRSRKQTEENLKPFSLAPNNELMEKLKTISDRAAPLMPRADNIFRHST